MSETNGILNKLQRIRELWIELERTKPNNPEYEKLMDKIRVLSSEYLALIEPSNVPPKSK